MPATDSLVVMSRMQGIYESYEKKLDGDCYGASVPVDVRGATDPRSYITVTQWFSDDGGVTWQKGAVNSGPGDPKYADAPIKEFSSFHAVADANGNAVPRWKAPLVKHTVEITGAPARVGLGEIKPVIDVLAAEVG